MQIYSLKDVKAGTFGNPLSFLNRAVAIRSLQEAAQVQDSLLSRHGADFQLFELGSFDTVSGRFEMLDTPDYVITVSELLPPTRAAA